MHIVLTTIYYGSNSSNDTAASDLLVTGIVDGYAFLVKFCRNFVRPCTFSLINDTDTKCHTLRLMMWRKVETRPGTTTKTEAKHNAASPALRFQTVSRPGAAASDA
jgi:hypothetical protein